MTGQSLYLVSERLARAVAYRTAAAARNAHGGSECATADRIMVNSCWSMSALEQAGVEQDKIRVVPLAYDPPERAIGFCRFRVEQPLLALFLGQVHLRKGVGALLERISIIDVAGSSAQEAADLRAEKSQKNRRDIGYGDACVGAVSSGIVD